MSLKPGFADAPEAMAAPAGKRTPTGTQSAVGVAARRFVFGALTLATLFGMTGWLAAIVAADGLGVLDYLLLVAFFVAAPWFVIGFWNSLIGFGILQLARRSLAVTVPPVVKARDDDPLFIRTAILMTLRNENPARAFRRLRTIRASLEATGNGEHFDFYVLSDSSKPEVIEAERAAYAAAIAAFGGPERLIYRHREKNTGYKAGNVRDFCERWGKQYEVMLPLDADSLMTGAAIVRLIRVMQANPRLGILQSLVVGMPSPSFFARVFQFGMRHGMRSFTSGSAWWHADCGPFWGHNAAVRIAPFTEFCELPVLPGKPPFGGPILSHDQVEAVLMRRAGYEARVLPEEDGSYEENPPALLDYIGRDLRWCHGNLQYFKLLALPGLLLVNRIQIAMAIQMFLFSPAVILFVVFAALAAASWPTGVAFPAQSALLLYLVSAFMYFSPPIFGAADALLRAARSYGGAGRLLLGMLIKIVFMCLLVPNVLFNQTMFMVALLFGRNAGWAAQQRDGYRVPWRAAAGGLWQGTLFGLAVLLFLALAAPAAIGWFLPFLAGLILAIPFAVLTSLPALGEMAVQWRLCAIPEEFETPVEIATLLAPHHPGA